MWQKTRANLEAAVSERFRFSELEHHVPAGVSGVYQIWARDDIAVKVGIAGDLRERLRHHRASRQSGLVLKPGGDWSDPATVVSKKSILAKHLYFDERIAPEYDLKSEAGRRRFLEERCIVTVQVTDTREQAREIERSLEADGLFRYGRTVVKRFES